MLIKALVTGGSGDIGAAICQKLAHQGLHVIVHSNHRREKAQAVVDDIMTQGGSAESINFDIRNADDCLRALQPLLIDSPIQVLINNAGIHRDAPLIGMQREQWTEVVDVNLHGFFNVTQPLLMPMIRSRWGRIVNISSIAGVMGNRGQCNYAATKAALHGATKSLALELASRKITVNTVAPGIIESTASEESFPQELIKKMVPMQRAGKAEEVAALVAFLCSPEAAYISGQLININGAMN